MKLAAECVKDRVAIDMFYTVANSQKSVDLATMAVLPSQTGGDLHYFCPFDPLKHGEKLHYEIYRSLTRTQATDV